MLVWKLALQVIRGSKKFSFFFIFNIVLGLFGFVGIDCFQNAFQRHLVDNSKKFFLLIYLSLLAGC